MTFRGAVIVTFVIGFRMLLSNSVTRAVTLRATTTLTPPSPPTSRSGTSV